MTAPIRGVVVGREGRNLLVKLETGPTIKWPDRGNLNMFEKVNVGFNFFSREINAVMKCIDGIEEDPECPDDSDETDGDMEYDDTPDYGVL